MRDFNDWELDMVGDLLHTLRGHRPSLEKDSVMWRQGRNGLFRVKEAYRLLDKPNATLFPSRSIWVDRVPTKVCFFAWEATWGKDESFHFFCRNFFEISGFGGRRYKRGGRNVDRICINY